MKIEPIKPIINKIPKRMKQSETNPSCVEVLEYEEIQNGYYFGEDGLVGKINEIINWINIKDNQLL